MNGSQCDNCRTFRRSPDTTGWLNLTRRTADKASVVALYAGAATETVGTFCSVKCVAEYTYTLAATEETSERA